MVPACSECCINASDWLVSTMKLIVVGEETERMTQFLPVCILSSVPCPGSSYHLSVAERKGLSWHLLALVEVRPWEALSSLPCLRLLSLPCCCSYASLKGAPQSPAC